MWNKTGLVFGLTALLLLATPSRATPAVTLKVSGDPTITDVNNFFVTANVTNTGDETLKLYQHPHGVLSTFPGNSFVITSTDDGTVDFVGGTAKYDFNSATNFITLEPGSSNIVNHDVSQAYSFNKVGDYNIEPNPIVFYQDASGSPVALHASSVSPHVAKVSGPLTSTRRAKKREELIERQEDLEKREEFVGCSDIQALAITLSMIGALEYIGISLTFLQSLGSSIDPYLLWFGAYTPARADKVFSHFNAIFKDNITSYTYSCECAEDIYGYVRDITPKNMFFCNGFWNAPLTGYDSKAGAIIFLASLWPSNGDLDNSAYSGTQAAALAVSDPEKAVMSAVNHEYFAETFPLQ